jgi:hypothetical protein
VDDKDFIKKIEDAALDEIKMPKNKEYIKKVLVFKAKQQSKKMPMAVRLIPVYAVVLAIAAVSSYMMIIDYNNTDTKFNELGGVWCTYDDHYQGGDSTVWPPASVKGENNFVKSSPGSSGKGYAIRITGTAGTKLGWDYIGVNTFLSPRSTCPECVGIDLSRFTGIKFKIKGRVEAGKVVFIFPHEAHVIDKSRGICKSLTSYADYEADITKYITPNWKKVKINFRKDLKQPDWAKPENRYDIEKVLSDANLIKWQYENGGGHKVDIWIDKLEFY